MKFCSLKKYKAEMLLAEELEKFLNEFIENPTELVKCNISVSKVSKTYRSLVTNIYFFGVIAIRFNKYELITSTWTEEQCKEFAARYESIENIAKLEKELL